MRRLPSPVARFSRHDTVATWTEHGVDRGRADGHRDLRAQALAVGCAHRHRAAHSRRGALHRLGPGRCTTSTPRSSDSRTAGVRGCRRTFISAIGELGHAAVVRDGVRGRGDVPSSPRRPAQPKCDGAVGGRRLAGADGRPSRPRWWALRGRGARRMRRVASVRAEHVVSSIDMPSRSKPWRTARNSPVDRSTNARPARAHQRCDTAPPRATAPKVVANRRVAKNCGNALPPAATQLHRAVPRSRPRHPTPTTTRVREPGSLRRC